MKFKGTKGEWIITEVKDTNGFLYVGKYKNDSRIATCYTVDAEGAWEGLVTEETRANAKLIASAPDLLEALQSFVSDFEMDYVISDGTIVDNPPKILVINYKIAKEAINKALN